MNVTVLFCLAACLTVCFAHSQKKECNEICPMIYAPVCGTDGTTYSNECQLKVAQCKYNCKLQKDYDGECKKGNGNQECPKKDSTDTSSKNSH